MRISAKVLVLLLVAAIVSQANALTDDLNTKALWHMEETLPNPNHSGLEYVPDDTSVRGGDGEPLYMMHPTTAAPSTAPTVSNGVMTFDGVDDVAFGDNTWEGDTSTVSVDFSFKAAATSDGTYEYMIGTYGNWRIFLMNTGGTTTLKAYVFTDSALTDSKMVWIGGYGTQITRGVWYDAHFEIDENLLMSLSLNNYTEQVQLTVFNTGTTYGGNITVGAWPFNPTEPTANFAGSLNEVKVSVWSEEAAALGDVSDFRALPGDEQIILDWTNPTHPDFVGVKILRKTGSYPTGPTDGTTIYEGAGTSTLDTGLTNGTTYYYKAFSYDAVPNYSSGIATSNTPRTSECGDWGYLPADIYPDCYVNLLDFSLLAQQWLGCTGDDCGGLSDLAFWWLACTDPGNGACIPGQQQQIVGESFVLAGTQASKFWFDQIVPGSVHARSSYASGTGYQEGVDYVIDYAQGTVTRTAGSAIPDYSNHPQYGVSEFTGLAPNHSYFVWFDYTTNSPDTVIQKTDSQHPYLQNSLTTLSQGGALKVIVYGDSISNGGEASAFQWRYEERFHQYLVDLYPSATITYVNNSTGGWTSSNGLANLNASVLTQSPDLVLLAFGMNDHNALPPVGIGIPLATYKANIKSMCQQINTVGAEVIVLGSMPPNTAWAYDQGIMDQYAAAAGEAASETGNAFTNVYSLWMRALDRKDYNLGEESLLGNNINHPNDFGHWMYFKALEEIW